MSIKLSGPTLSGRSFIFVNLSQPVVVVLKGRLQERRPADKGFRR
jgi:hypothetical protein